MAQASLNPGVGNFVADALAPVLADGSDIESTGNGSWVSVDRPWDVAVVMDTGTVTGTSVTVDVEIQAADDASGTNTVVLGSFATVTDADDDEERILVTQTHKPYMRYAATVSGTSPVAPLTITVRDQDYHLSEGRTA